MPAAIEQTLFDQDTTCCTVIIREAQEAGEFRTWCYSIKKIAGQLRSKLLQRLQNTTAEDQCFAHENKYPLTTSVEQMTRRRMRSKKGFSVSDTLAIIPTKISTCLGAKNNKPILKSKKFEEIEIISTNYSNSFQKDQVEPSLQGRSPRNGGKPSSSSRRNRELSGATSAVTVEYSEDFNFTN